MTEKDTHEDDSRDDSARERSATASSEAEGLDAGGLEADGVEDTSTNPLSPTANAREDAGRDVDLQDGIEQRGTPSTESIRTEGGFTRGTTDAASSGGESEGGGLFDTGEDSPLDADDGPGLFDDLLSGEPIFENKEVLRPSYTPHELPHRNDQINQIATILVAALRGETPSNILIYGKTGTGKTASAKFVSQELEHTSQKYAVPCEVEYINCEVTDTQYRVLAQLANKFIEKNEEYIDDRIEELEDLEEDATRNPGALADTAFGSVEEVLARIEDLREDRTEMETVPMTGWPTDRVYSTFFDAVDYQERVVVIMLDEIDKLVEKSGDDTLYNLSRMNSELENSRVSIMGISNDLKFTDFLDPRVKSSLGEEEIVFPPYDANQLRDILQHRSDVAFKPDALTDDVIPLCAAFAAQEHGDARRALDLLRTAGELAERDKAEIVDEEHVRRAQDKIELDRVVEVVRTLPTQSKLVLFAIISLEQNGVHNINTGEVFNIYKRLCEEINADVLTQRRVTDLISELDMLGIVNAIVVSKGRYGRTKEISLSVPIQDTEAVLLSDSRLGDIESAQPFVQARFDN
jgi:cell division control protein 6